MNYYSKEEQETHFNYDGLTDKWTVFTSVPSHIKRALYLIKRDNCTVLREEKNVEGFTISIELEGLKTGQLTPFLVKKLRPSKQDKKEG